MKSLQTVSESETKKKTSHPSTGQKDDEQDASAGKHTTVHEQSDEADDETEIEPSVAGSEATTVIREVPKPYKEINDSTNFLSPIKPRFDKIKEQILPEQFNERNRFERLRL